MGILSEEKNNSDDGQILDNLLYRHCDNHPDTTLLLAKKCSFCLFLFSFFFALYTVFFSELMQS